MRYRATHATKLGSPFVKRGIADTVLATQLLRTKPSLMLFQYSYDLFFAETASLHRLSPQLENRLTKKTGLFRGAGQC